MSRVHTSLQKLYPRDMAFSGTCAFADDAVTTIMPKPLHEPHHTIVRKVLLYPTNGDEPRLIDGVFSEEGANRSFSLYTTALDLRNSYGKYIAGTRSARVDIGNWGFWCGGEPEHVKPEYAVHYNTDVRLPLNRAMARVLGIDPERLDTRPTCRGDVILVMARSDCPGRRSTHELSRC
jgi:hypothetical protein